MPSDIMATDNKIKLKHWDVIVTGGGPGGIPASVSCARNGARTLLIERYGFLGGMATAGLVQPYMTYKTKKETIIRGLFEEFVNILHVNGAMQDDLKKFDSEMMKLLVDRFVIDSGVQLLLHTQAIGVLKEGKKIKAVRVFHKGGVEDLSADIFLDSTGDGDISTWSGAKIETGRTQDGACQPMTTCFQMANVNIDNMPARDEINQLYNRAKEQGEINNPREDVLKFGTIHPDVIHFNTTRITGKSAINGWEMTEAEIEGRRQVDQMIKFLKKYIRGFEESYLMRIGTQIGVRESRRVIGKYILTADDVLNAVHFEDGIACACYGIDIHNPTGTGTQRQHLKPGTYYTIPYRCLVPERVDNLLISSRCISSTHEAHSSLRVQPIVWAIGQAAGTAAALCIKKKINPSELDASILRTLLKKQNAFI